VSAADSPGRPPIGFDRRFTRADIDPYAALDWERRAAHIENWTDGSVAFHQDDVEFPRHWSQNATNIVAQKYFRGHLGTAEREQSLRQVIDRVVGTISSWGSAGDYFADDAEFEAFVDELTHLLVDQRSAFNSPVWFNIGVPDTPQQSSACFILSVDDTMDDILEWYVEEGKIFKGGSGSGVNLSRIRASSEQLNGGGHPSGPVSFMRGADASAGTIKSGGKTRRAAKMVILDADHPDIDEFVWTKAKEEHKARALRAAGFDMSLDGADSFSIQYQNANNSVRVTDEFMEAVEADRDWDLVARTTGDVVATVSARLLFRDIATAAWECADPGLQYDTTINRWHTCPESGRISGSNPCFPGSARVHTDKGLIRFEDLVERVNGGETFAVYTHDATAAEPRHQVVVSRPEAIHLTGTNPIVRLEFSNGQVLRCTPNHAIWTDDTGWVPAAELTSEHRIRVLDLATPASMANHKLPVPTDDAFYRRKGDHAHPIVLPDAWTEPLAHYLGWLVGDGCMTTADVATIHGATDEQEEILPAHQALLTSINGGRVPVPSVQANGTHQLRIGRRAVKAFFEALGLAPVKAPFKTVPWSVYEAPPEMQAAFLRGLFDADGCVVFNQRKGSYVGVGSASIELLRGTQQLLAGLGVASSIHQTRDAVERGAFSHERRDGSRAEYASSVMFDLRINGADISRFASTVGFGLERKSATLGEILDSWTTGPYRVDTTVRLLSCIPDGFERTYNLTEPRNHSYVVDGVVVRNCSEYVHLDDSACNLSSLNLLRFLDDDDRFDIEGFRHAVRVMIAAQEMLVSNSHYPTERIGENAETYRQLGLGYTNLGALLMSLGLPYDSDDGRALAATITALMTGEAYRTSALVSVPSPVTDPTPRPPGTSCTCIETRSTTSRRRIRCPTSSATQPVRPGTTPSPYPRSTVSATPRSRCWPRRAPSAS
jgi:ribonucleoside-diphosphate reductase alpha chain